MKYQSQVQSKCDKRYRVPVVVCMSGCSESSLDGLGEVAVVVSFVKWMVKRGKKR